MRRVHAFVRLPVVLLLAGAALLAAASHAAPTPAPAAVATSTQAPNWYNVELIVFRTMDPAAGTQETWPADPGQPDWNGAVALNPANSIGPPLPYQLLSPVDEQLDDDWTRLKRSHDYEPLLHVTWTQPVLDRASAPAVRIGVPPSAVPAPGTGSGPAVGVTSAPANPGSAPGTPPLVATPVYGDAKLSTTGPYLHFDLDLDFQGPPLSNSPAVGATTTAGLSMDALNPGTNAAAPAAPAFQLYRLDQDRRIDAGKLNYFDHPMFGVLVLVTPVKKQQ